MRTFQLIPFLFCCISFTSCVKDKTNDSEKAQAYSVDGTALFIPERSDETQQQLESNLEEAQRNFDADPNEMNTIWLGRRWAYLTRYDKAIEVFSEGLARFPESYKLYRHRGHRYISTRHFDKAIADYKKAYALMPKGTTETEPDGAPNSLNIPLSNTQFNILYHYGLALYLKGDFERASEIYKECMKYSINDDLKVATTDWLYMSLKREGKKEEAEGLLRTISSDMKIIENDSYYKRLQMYRGELAIEELLKTDEEDVSLSMATQGYGMGNWYLYHGDTVKAKEIFQDVLSTGNWPAFGYIASEVDLYGLK